ncbi:hypothetical protein AMECASPLE_011748 [Ameca splendens]|uniref:Uncharacterized protein n=1 Tax=Ameca splendens TaxID=208324 RepID=A0ABV0YP38_9TELE
MMGLPLIYFPSSTCQICISGARPRGIRYKKDSFYIPKLILSSIGASCKFQSLQPERDRLSEMWPLQALPSPTVSICLHPSSRFIYLEDQLSVLSVLESFK